MECLYKTTTKFTIEEYKKFNAALIKKRHITVLTVLVFILFLIAGILLENYFLIIFAILFPGLLYFAIKMSIQKIFNSNKLLQNAEVTYEFYEDYMIEKHEGGEAKVPYEKLNEIIETKTNFYLMIAQNQGFMISKEGMPEGLEEFIRNKKG